MNKKLLALVVVIIALAIGGYAVFHKSPAKPTTSNTASTSTPAQSSSASGPVVQTKSSGSVGQYLADANGATLYTYGADTNGVSNCNGSCLYDWPFYAAANAPSSLPANVTVISRSDGTKQYAYKGLPLYTFTGDPVGQVTGDGVSNFHVAKP